MGQPYQAIAGLVGGFTREIEGGTRQQHLSRLRERGQLLKHDRSP
jgi:hypothetical protein